MIERFKSRPALAALAAAAITALGVGGVAVAQSSGGAEQQAQTQGASEKGDGSETADRNEAADDDGPGGHADEPADGSAEHEAQGQE